MHGLVSFLHTRYEELMWSFFQPILNCLNKREQQQNYIQILYLGHRFRSCQECCEHQAVPTQIAHKAPRNQSNACLQDQLFSTEEVNKVKICLRFGSCISVFWIFWASEIWASHGPRKIYSTWRNLWGIRMKQKHYVPLNFWNSNWIDNCRSYPKITIFLHQSGSFSTR